MHLYAPRFWAKVQRAGPDDCWIWLSSRNRKGYGTFWLSGCRSAHRVSYEMAYGPIPDGMMLLHSCDNPPCVNPRHLSPGTNSDNQRDSAVKGRHVSLRGDGGNAAKLTVGDVREIKAALGEGMSGVELARRYGVTDGAISHIKTGFHWGHI